MQSKQLLIIIFYCLASNGVFSQDKSNIEYGKVSAKDFEIPHSKVIDTGCTGIIISDVGNISFVGNTNGGFNYVFRQKKRVMILKKSAFDLASIKIRLYVS